ncbi:MAG: hypothetical protein AAFQ19_04875 [Pseudomonadota bacterium]
MNTWTCKGLLVAALCLGLTGCDEGGAGLSFAVLTPHAPSQALTEAELGRGALTLVPPNGFCIDKRSLRHSFALMARCDVLGADGGAGAPLAVITATAVVAAQDQARTVLKAAGEVVLSERSDDAVALVQVRGTPPMPMMRDVYWRATAQVGDHLLGLALYQPDSAGDLGSTAPDLLVQTMRRTQAHSVRAQDNSATTGANQTGNGFLAGLFQ